MRDRNAGDISPLCGLLSILKLCSLQPTSAVPQAEFATAPAFPEAGVAVAYAPQPGMAYPSQPGVAYTPQPGMAVAAQPGMVYSAQPGMTVQGHMTVPPQQNQPMVMVPVAPATVPVQSRPANMGPAGWPAQ